MGPLGPRKAAGQKKYRNSVSFVWFWRLAIRMATAQLTKVVGHAFYGDGHVCLGFGYAPLFSQVYTIAAHQRKARDEGYVESRGAYYGVDLEDLA